MQGSSPTPWTRPSLLTVAACALILFAFARALLATADLQWPSEFDFFRDMGGAQAILDGYGGADPAYLGEINWFNPLQPRICAAISTLTGLSLPSVYARSGPFLNLLGPIGFYILARQLLGGLAALAALGAYLFLGKPDVESWFQATYSPWAWPMDFAQGFFYLTVAAYVRAVSTRRLYWDIITGVLLGFTFLAHTAPTLVFVVMLFLLTALSCRPDRVLALRRLLVVGVVSLLLASPFLVPLLMHYHLQVLNRAPSEHEPIGVRFVIENLFTFRAAIAGLGLAVLAAYRSTMPARVDDSDDTNDGSRAAVLSALLASSVGLLGYGLLAQGLQHRGIADLPRILPTYHFHLYLKAAESLLFGLGSVVAVRFLLAKCLTPTANMEKRMLLAILALILLAHLPGYLGGVELNKFRQDSQRFADQTQRIDLYDWLRKATKPTDVFLADRNIGFLAVAAADRKVVALGEQYSNIYVDYTERAGDLDRLFASLRDQDHEVFDNQANKYQLTHVILTKATQNEFLVCPDRMTSDRFTLVFENNDYSVYRRK